VHHLVLEAFVGPCPPGQEARHVNDNDRANNALSNLAWGTHRENCADRDRHGATARGDRNGAKTMPHRIARGDRHSSRTRRECRPRGEAHSQRRLTAAQAANLRARFERGENRVALAREFGVSRRTVWVVGTGRGWAHVPSEQEVVS
jgi:hypothetical protein